jgi:uncharacterized protein YebE (UPF0316 family)
VIIFTLNTISTTLGNLKTVFLSRQVLKPLYVTTFIDALVFAYAFKLIAGASGIGYIFAFAFGRLFGVFLGTTIEKRLVIGILEITIYKHVDQGILLADTLRKSGYSVTTTKGHGIQGKARLVLDIVVARKDFPELKKLLAQDGNINMFIRNINKATGKIVVNKLRPRPQ